MNRSIEKYLDFFKGWIEVNKSYWQSLKDSSLLSRKVSIPIDDLYNTILQDSHPIFVLSTGRCGSKLLSNLIERIPYNHVAHAPKPEMNHHNAVAFQHQSNIERLTNLFLGARYEMMRDQFILGNRFIETNNRVTFFAHAIAKLFPNAKFIFLYRDVFSFVKSGLGRNWYSGNTLNDEGRIKLKDQHIFDQWSQHEKITWLWVETNLFIHNFWQENLDRTLVLPSAKLFSDANAIGDMFNELKLGPISINLIEKIIAKPVNKQAKGKKRNLSQQETESINKFLEQQDLPTYLKA